MRTDAYYNALVFDMYNVKWNVFVIPGRKEARHIFNKLDLNLQHLIQLITNAKLIASTRRLGRPLASPAIPNVRIEEFLKDLGDGNPGLEPPEIAAYEYIKSTAITEANILATNRGFK